MQISYLTRINLNFFLKINYAYREGRAMYQPVQFLVRPEEGVRFYNDGVTGNFEKHNTSVLGTNAGTLQE